MNAYHDQLVEFKPGVPTITLRGVFNIADLEAMLKLMKADKEKQDANIK